MKAILSEASLSGVKLPTSEELIESEDILVSMVEYYVKHTKIGKKLIKEVEQEKESEGKDKDKDGKVIVYPTDEEEVASLIIANLIGLREHVVVREHELWYFDRFILALKDIASDIGMEFDNEEVSLYLKCAKDIKTSSPIDTWWIVNSFTGFSSKSTWKAVEEVVVGLKNFVWGYLDNAMSYTIENNMTAEEFKETNEAVKKFFIDLSYYGYDIFVIAAKIAYLSRNADTIVQFSKDYINSPKSVRSSGKYKEDREETLTSNYEDYVPYEDIINTPDFQIKCLQIINDISSLSREDRTKFVAKISSLHNLM